MSNDAFSDSLDINLGKVLHFQCTLSEQFMFQVHTPTQFRHILFYLCIFAEFSFVRNVTDLKIIARILLIF